jgi:hypothetical protein
MLTAETPPDVGTVFHSPSPTSEVAAATPVALDLRTLLAPVEISDALGESVEVQPGLQTGSCIWVATTGGGQVSDTTTNTQAVAFHTVSDAWHMATAGGYRWATDSTAGGILKLDPLTGELIRKVTWGVAPIAIAADP